MPRNARDNRLQIAEPIEFQRGSINVLADRILEVTSQIEDLKEKRGIALLDGKDFDNSCIQALDNELDALRSAEAEAVKRQRKEEEAARERRREVVRSKIRETEPKRIEAVRAAESAALALMVSLRDVETYSSVLDTDMRLLGVVSDKTNHDGIKERFSRRLTAVLKPLLVTGWRRYGSISFPEPQDCFVHDWAAEESALIADHIVQALRPTANE